ncbi:MAG TPA: histidine kinase [Terriglobales bacterium]|nr:histidine kinase [Terriglobales bacterium]
MRKWLFPFFWPNVAVGVVVLVLLLLRQFSSVSQFLHVLGYALLYSNLVAIFAMVVVGALAKRFAWRKYPLALMLVFCVVVLVPLGCLMVQVMLTSFGVLPWQYFWSQYFSMMRVTIPLAAVFGLGAFVHSSLRERLQVTEQKLHEKEVAEERAKKLATEARLRSLESRIHPHFLFNTLNSISSLIAVNPARAEQIVGRLAALLRASLDNSNQPLIPLQQELAMVESYLDIERARFGAKLRGSVNVPSELQNAKVPPMSVQALVENAVKYGITPQSGGGQVSVTARAENGDVKIEVSDTGPGFDLTAVPAGHGLDNLVERLDALFGARARLNASRLDGHCVVEMVVPRV